MNRSTYRIGALVLGIAAMALLWGCGPSNPDQLSFRLTGYYIAQYDPELGTCDLDNADGLASFAGGVGALREVPCYFVEFTNYLEGSEDLAPNAALGNVVLEKVQAVARIRGTGKYLPTATFLSSSQIDALVGTGEEGSRFYFGMNVLPDEWVTALYSNENALPPFPFEIDIAYTGFARYAGSEYRATGSITAVVTGW